MKYALFIGRWQPFHEGHKYIVDQALEQEKNVCIAIRDTGIDRDNPYTVIERRHMIWKIYRNKVKVIVIPDIESINYGRGVGYEINEIKVPQDIARISGTEIRKTNDID